MGSEGKEGDEGRRGGPQVNATAAVVVVVGADLWRLALRGRRRTRNRRERLTDLPPGPACLRDSYLDGSIDDRFAPGGMVERQKRW